MLQLGIRQSTTGVPSMFRSLIEEVEAMQRHGA